MELLKEKVKIQARTIFSNQFKLFRELADENLELGKTFAIPHRKSKSKPHNSKKTQVKEKKTHEKTTDGKYRDKKRLEEIR